MTKTNLPLSINFVNQFQILAYFDIKWHRIGKYFISEELYKEMNIILQPETSILGLNSGFCLQRGFSVTRELLQTT